jgi:hypothetical protein
MNVQNLYETLALLEQLDEELELQKTLTTITQNLHVLVQTPGQPGAQENLAKALLALSLGAEKLREAISPFRMAVLTPLAVRSSLSMPCTKRYRSRSLRMR